MTEGMTDEISEAIIVMNFRKRLRHIDVLCILGGFVPLCKPGQLRIEFIYGQFRGQYNVGAGIAKRTHPIIQVFLDIGILKGKVWNHYAELKISVGWRVF